MIAAHDAGATLGDQLAALAQQKIDVATEIIVVDNASADDTAAVARDRATLDPRIRLVTAADGRGAGYARNVGVAATDATWLAFCDADDVVADGWLEAIAGALAEHRFTAGPIELDRLNPAWIVESRGRSFSTEPTTFFDIFPTASSCNMGLHREVFDDVGGFDESFLIGQDAELSMRLWQAGVELHFCADAVVHYRYRPTLRAVFGQSRRFAAVQPVFAERLRAAGHPTPSRWAGARQWLWLLRNLPRLASRPGRARWLFVAGRQVGRVQGGIRVRRLTI